MENVFFLNENLQLVEYKSDAVAIAYYFKDECPDSLYPLGDKRFKKNVEITFLKPIGHSATLHQSDECLKAWKNEHYPQYNSFLPSEDICRLISRKLRKEFNNCWTRSDSNDDYPTYRYYPILFKDGIMYLADSSNIAENVYPSLVLTKEEFLEINPNAKLVD
jgi:hypothetical protein